MADKTPVDENGDATTQLHEVMADAVHDAITDPFKPTPRRGLAGEVIDGPTPQPHGGTTPSGDDGDNSSDSGNDVDISSAGDKDDEFKVNTPVSPFAQYASHTPREAAARFSASQDGVGKQFGTPENLHPSQFGARTSDVAPAHDATSDAVADGDKLHIVGGNSAVLDGNADRVLEAQIREATHTGANAVAELQAQQAAVRAPFLSVKAPMPVTVALNPLARRPTPL